MVSNKEINRKFQKKRYGKSICPECETENPVDAAFCQECGYKLDKVDIKHDKYTGKPIDNKPARCPYCAEEINPGAVKCKHCGEWLNTRPNTTSKPDNHNAAIILGYFFSFLGGIIGFIFAFYLLSLSNKNDRLHGLLMLFINSFWLYLLFYLILGILYYYIGFFLILCIILVGIVLYTRK